jgi:hypothetical protein
LKTKQNDLTKKRKTKKERMAEKICGVGVSKLNRSIRRSIMITEIVERITKRRNRNNTKDISVRLVI